MIVWAGFIVCWSLCVATAVGAEEEDEHEAAIRAQQERTGQEILVVLMGNDTARYRDALEASLDPESVRFVESAGGGWRRLELRRLLLREHLDCGFLLTTNARGEIERVTAGSCPPAVSLEPDQELVVDAPPAPAPKLPRAGPWPPLRPWMEVASPKRMTASYNYVGVPFLLRPTVEIRLAPRHGLTNLGMFSLMGLMGIGLGYRFSYWGSFDRGLQLACETGQITIFGRHGTDSFPFRALMTGGKYSFDVGLTFEIQVGAAWLDGEPQPNANLNIGWSFWPVRP
jgi:hypothetical protein